MTRPHRRLTDEAAHLLTLSTEPWLSCEDCFRLMDAFAEAVLADAGTAAFPEMRVHLGGCGACAEEAASLLDLLVDDRDAR
jgi:hypothetical protein